MRKMAIRYFIEHFIHFGGTTKNIFTGARAKKKPPEGSL
jgi:hypothetical protein